MYAAEAHIAGDVHGLETLLRAVPHVFMGAKTCSTADGGFLTG